MADDIDPQHRETSMSKHTLEQKSSAQHEIGKALDDKDLAQVTGGDKPRTKETPTESVAFSFGHIEFQYSGH
jgi:bacteriocin-like protein